MKKALLTLLLSCSVVMSFASQDVESTVPVTKKCGTTKVFDNILVKNSARVRRDVVATQALCAQVITANTVNALQTNSVDVITTNTQVNNLSGTNATINEINGVVTINGLSITGLLEPSGTGFTGFTGNSGNAGPAGALGATGPQGAQGPTGTFLQDNLFSVYKTNTQVGLTPSTPVAYNVIAFNDQWTITGAGTIFTAPSTGLYRISFTVTFDVDAAPDSIAVAAQINGNNYEPSWTAAAILDGDFFRTLSNSFVASLSANDVVRLLVGGDANDAIQGLPVNATLNAVKL